MEVSQAAEPSSYEAETGPSRLYVYTEPIHQEVKSLVDATDSEAGDTQPPPEDEDPTYDKDPRDPLNNLWEREYQDPRAHEITTRVLDQVRNLINHTMILSSGL